MCLGAGLGHLLTRTAHSCVSRAACGSGPSAHLPSALLTMRSPMLLAFHSITKPMCLLFPFNSTHFWNGFLWLFILSSSPTFDRIWAHRIICLLHLLSVNTRQFSSVLNLQSTTSKSEQTKICESQLKNPVIVFSARPTLLLRVITPTGFSVTIRALVDSGSTSTIVKNELATLLLSNGVTTKYFWPLPIILFPGSQQLYRSLSEIKLQSLEDETVIVSATSIFVDEIIPYTVDWTPVDLVISKMASFGLPVIKKPLQNTMWSKKDPKYVKTIYFEQVV